MNNVDTDINKKLRDQARNLTKELKRLPHCLFVILIGSVARNTADEYSDIDLVVLYNKEPSVKELATHLGVKRLNKFWLNESSFHVHLKKCDQIIAPLFMPVASIQTRISQRSIISYEEYKELWLYIRNGKLLYGNKQIFSKWQRACKVVPEKLKRERIHREASSLNFYFTQGHLLQLAQRSDWTMIGRTMSAAVEWILTIVYLLNDRVYITPKSAAENLAHCRVKPKNLLKRLELLYLLENTMADTIRKISRVLSLIKDMEKLKEFRNFT